MKRNQSLNIIMRKPISFTLAIFLSLSFLATPGFSYSDCGKNCCCASDMTAMHPATPHPAQFNSNCCPEVAALPCGLKNSHQVEPPVCTLSVGRAHTYNPTLIVHNISDLFWTHNISEHKLFWLYADTSLQSSPIYLRYHSLLI